MQTQKILIAYGFGDVNRIRGRRKSISGKAKSRRAVKKQARTIDSNYETLCDRCADEANGIARKESAGE